MALQIQLRRDLAANWTSVNPILAQGEFGYELNTGKIKIGDGVTTWNSLPYKFNYTVITDHTGLTSIGTNTHAQIDAHLASTSNPHNTTASQVGAYTTTQTDTQISNAVTAHTSALDPHPQYETSAEAQSKVDAHANLTNNPHSVTKAQVGLGNVDNTSDLNKPISTATQTALNLKYDASNPAGYQTSAQVTTTVNSAISTHTAAADPHPQYLTSAEGNAAYDVLGSAATVQSNLSNHISASDPHPQYLTQTEGDGIYAPLAHNHDLSNLNQSGALTGYVAQWNGTSWVAAPETFAKYKTLTTKSSTSNTVFTNITEMTLNVVAGRSYRINIYLEYAATATATTGLAISIVGAGGATGFITGVARFQTTATVNEMRPIIALNQAIISTAVPAAVNSYLCVIEALFVCSTSGTIVPAFRSEVNGSQVQTYDGSIMLVTEI